MIRSILISLLLFVAMTNLRINMILLDWAADLAQRIKEPA